MIAYNYVSVRSLGDQPGRPTTRYLSSWKTLPEWSHDRQRKIRAAPQSNASDLTNYVGSQVLVMKVFGFNQTNNIPFPSEDTLPAAGNKRMLRYPTSLSTISASLLRARMN